MKTEDKTLFTLYGLTSISGFIFIALNAFYHRYSCPITFTTIMAGLKTVGPKTMLLTTATTFVLLGCIYYLQSNHQRLFTTKILLHILLSVLSFFILWLGIQFTPFPVIDLFLVQLDQWMGLNSLAVLNWTHAHPFLWQLAHFGFSSLPYQVLIVSILFILLQDHHMIYAFLYAFMVSALIGELIYYFYPTAGLSSIFYSPYFAHEQFVTTQQFFEIHHRLPVKEATIGVIEFPSFHVICGLLLTYAFRQIKVLFYPLLIINLLSIAGTVLLGRHYFVDVLGGAVVSYASILIANRLYVMKPIEQKSRSFVNEPN